MRIFVGFVLGVVAMIVAGVIYIYSGSYNVAASAPDGAVIGWALRTTRMHSIAARASAVQAPASFTDAEAMAGFQVYDHGCIACHGAPGIKPGGAAQAMNPAPPDLAKVAGHVDPATLFWVIKNGIKMSAMPAIGEHLPDAKLWNIVAFLQKLPGMTPAQYAAMRAPPAPPAGATAPATPGTPAAPPAK